MEDNEFEDSDALEKILKKMENNEGVESMNDAADYTLDLQLDEQGQNVEQENIVTNGNDEDDESIEKYSDTTFSGEIQSNGFTISLYDEAYAVFYMYEGDEAIITKVEDESVEVELDEKESNKKNVTIEEETDDEDIDASEDNY